MRLGQFARGGVELRRDRAAWIAFAHHRFQEHRLDVPALGFGVGKYLAQLLDVVGFDGDRVVVVGEAGQILDIGFARGIRIQRRQFGAAVERALDGDATDLAAGMCAARIGHQLGMHIGQTAGQGDRFGARIQAQKARVGTAAAGVSDLAAQAPDRGADG